jgi:hypothetical protein
MAKPVGGRGDDGHDVPDFDKWAILIGIAALAGGGILAASSIPLPPAALWGVALVFVGAGLIAAGGFGIFGGGPTGCFVEGTEVLMADMTQKPIEKISVDDVVLSRHEKTGLMAGRRVSKVFVHEVNSVLNFTLLSGETIGTTEAHRFALGAGNFSPARSIDVGARLSTEASTTELLGREIVRSRTKVYNFTVEEFNTYFVGKERVWVHNLKDDGEHDDPDDDE